MRKIHTLLFVNILSNIGWFSYFVLQGDFLSGVANVIGVLSNIVFIFRGKYSWADSKWWLALFIAVAGTYSLLTFKTYLDVFALIACVFSMIAFFMKKEKNIRIISLCSFAMFICNSVSKGYIVALIADITAVASIIISLYRYRQNKTDKAEELVNDIAKEDI